MAKTVIIHLIGQDPLVAQMERLPDPTDSCIVVNGPRSRDGKVPNYITEGANTVIFPMARINFVEVLTEESVQDDVFEFFREER